MSNWEPKHPDVTVQLIGEDGNIFFILGRVTQALKRAGYYESSDILAEEVMASDDYDEALQIVMRTVNVE